MAWIESHTTLARHPKTLRLAHLLGVSVPTVIGHLHLLWWWALEYAQDGRLAAFSAAEVARACMWEGDPAALRAGLQKSGFVERKQIHDWHDYAGKLIDRRAANRERMRSARDQHVSRTADADDGTRARHVQRTKPARAKHVQSDRTQPNQTEDGANAPSARTGAREASVPELLQAFHDAFTGVRGYAPTEAYFAKVAEKYRHLDLEEEAIKIRAWLAGRAKRDCSTAFILTWLKRAAEEAAAAPIAPLAGTNGAARNGATRRNGHAVDAETDEYVEAVFRSRSADDHRAPIGSLTDG